MQSDVSEITLLQEVVNAFTRDQALSLTLSTFTSLYLSFFSLHVITFCFLHNSLFTQFRYCQTQRNSTIFYKLFIIS